MGEKPRCFLPVCDRRGGEGPGGSWALSLFQLLFQLCWDPGIVLGCLIQTQTEPLLHQTALALQSPLLNIATFNNLSVFPELLFGWHCLLSWCHFGHNSCFCFSFLFYPCAPQTCTLEAHSHSPLPKPLCPWRKGISSNAALLWYQTMPRADFGAVFHPASCSNCNEAAQTGSLALVFPLLEEN